MLEMLDNLPTYMFHGIVFIIFLSSFGLCLKLLDLNKPDRHAKIIGIAQLFSVILIACCCDPYIYESIILGWKDIIIIFVALFWIYVITVLIQHIALEEVRYKQSWILALIKSDYIKYKDDITRLAEELTNEKSEEKAIIYIIILNAIVMPVLYLGYYLLKHVIYLD